MALPTQPAGPYPPVPDLTRDELSLLLFLETRCVDHGGAVTAGNMNKADIETAQRWNARGFVLFGRLEVADWMGVGQRRCSHWCRLSKMAWAVVAMERKARAERSESEIVKAYPRGRGGGGS